MNITKQIIEKVNEHNLSPESTEKELFMWYEYALRNGLIEYETDNGKVTGFMDWVRLERAPETMRKAYEIYTNQDHDITQPVLFCGNCITDNSNIFFRLRRKILDKNKDAEVQCFWHGKRKRMVVLNRRQLCH